MIRATLNISNDELDEITAQIVDIFPNFDETLKGIYNTNSIILLRNIVYCIVPSEIVNFCYFIVFVLLKSVFQPDKCC